MLKFFLISLLLKYVDCDVSYYEVLGVSKQANLQEIRQAYKKLAVKLHPDKNSDSKEQKKFLEITEAYETLKDPNKKRHYDLYGSHQSYTHKYDYHSQSEYNNLYYNGLYHDDPFVKTLNGEEYYQYLHDGLYFINFYSPFCPPCQSLADDWKKLAGAYKGIMKIAAVNCKYHNSFCYNNMRIGSYPSLYFYPNGKHANYIYYNGAHTFEALEKFILNHINSKINIVHVTQEISPDGPILYLLDEHRLDANVLTRVAFQLNGLATVAIPSKTISKKLTDNDEAIFVFKSKETHKEITSSDEDAIIKDVVDSLPKLQSIGLNNLKTIRNNLKSSEDDPWVLFFFRKGDDKLPAHQARAALTEMEFGEVNCDDNRDLCTSFGVERTPDWSVLKVGGAFQRVAPPTHRELRRAVHARALHSLSATDAARVLHGDTSTWVLLVSPYGISWEHLNEPFTAASLELGDTGINFGILSCNLNTDKYCREVTENNPVILVQNGTNRHLYNGHSSKDDIVEFIQLLRETSDLLLTEEDVLDLVHKRSTGSLVAFLPKCGITCDRLLHEMRIVARRLRALAVRVGVLWCGHAHGFCSNVRAPALRYYPPAATRLYSVSLQNLSEAPYILEWALEYIDQSVTALSWKTFSNTVIAEELNPSSVKTPWLVYFHSPRCYHCYEMYPDFAILSILLKNTMQFGKVDCVTSRDLCRHEHITRYPSIKLYVSRNRNTASRVIALQAKHYLSLLQDIRPHITKYDDDLLQNIQNIGIKSHIRDEL